MARIAWLPYEGGSAPSRSSVRVKFDRDMRRACAVYGGGGGGGRGQRRLQPCVFRYLYAEAKAASRVYTAARLLQKQYNTRPQEREELIHILSFFRHKWKPFSNLSHKTVQSQHTPCRRANLQQKAPSRGRRLLNRLIFSINGQGIQKNAF